MRTPRVVAGIWAEASQRAVIWKQTGNAKIFRQRKGSMDKKSRSLFDKLSSGRINLIRTTTHACYRGQKAFTCPVFDLRGGCEVLLWFLIVRGSSPQGWTKTLKIPIGCLTLDTQKSKAKDRLTPILWGTFLMKEKASGGIQTDDLRDLSDGLPL